MNTNTPPAAPEATAESSRSARRYWMVTINNPTDIDRIQCATLATQCIYAVYADEVGESGTPHIQGFIQLRDGRRLSWLKKYIPRAALHACNGTAKQASDYCKKGKQSHDEWKEFGTEGPNYGKDAKFTEHGKLLERHRTHRARKDVDYAQIVDAAKKHKFDEIDAGMYLRYQASIKRIAQDNPRKIEDLPYVTGHWYYGPPGTGKSSTARLEHPGGFYDKPCNKWWDGYRDEDVVIIDDFDLNHKVLATFVKRWTDRYSFPAEMKGTTIQIRPLKVVITSNYTPEEIWADDPTTAAAVRRRCLFKHFPAGNVFVPARIVAAELPIRPVRARDWLDRTNVEIEEARLTIQQIVRELEEEQHPQGVEGVIRPGNPVPPPSEHSFSYSESNDQENIECSEMLE